MTTLLSLLFSLMSLLSGVPTDSVTLVFAGDAMQHDSQLKAAAQTNGSYDYSTYFTAIKPYIEAADLAVVNLETPLGGEPYSGYPMFCAPDSYLDALTDAGFDFILAANNHTLDRRDKGVCRTIETFRKRGVPYAGIYRNRAERDTVCPAIIDVNGFKIAILNYTYGTNGIKIQRDVVVDYIDRNVISRDIAHARQLGAEIIVTAMHWGDEYKLLPNQSQKRLADWLIDLGVDLIIGGHPHVIQPMEMRHSDKHDKDVFLVYSLGNFISGMKKTDTQGGAMARVTLKRDKDGRAIVSNPSYRLVFVERPGAGVRNFRLLPAETSPARTDQRNACNAFTRSALNIFNKHNVNVPRDTSPIGR